jgi:hypothetical protein
MHLIVRGCDVKFYDTSMVDISRKYMSQHQIPSSYFISFKIYEKIAEWRKIADIALFLAGFNA